VLLPSSAYNEDGIISQKTIISIAFTQLFSCFPNTLLCWDSTSIFASFFVLSDSPLTLILSLSILFYPFHTQGIRKNSFTTVLNFPVLFLSYYRAILQLLNYFILIFLLSYLLFFFSRSFYSSISSSL
jgi:hypothetical protein